MYDSSFENITSSKKIFALEICFFVREYYFSKTKPNIYLLRNMRFFSFENMHVPKKVDCLLRKYDLFILEYAKATAKCDEIIVF